MGNVTRWIKTKPGAVKLAGVTVEARMLESACQSIELTDAAGGRLLISSTTWGGFEVYIPAPPTMVDRYRLSGTLRGLAVCEDFQSRSEADRRREALAEDVSVAEFELSVALVKVEEPEEAA